MDHPVLEKLYHPENYRTIGHQLIDILADYLNQNYKNDIKVNNYQNAIDSLHSWEKFLSEDHDLLAFFKKILNDSMHVHNPNYMGHQVSVSAPIASFGGLISDLLSNGMAVYEMGAASSVLEKKSIEIINKAVGYDKDSGGFLTSGGTLANLTALLTARSIKIPEDVWQNGYEDQSYAVMVSEQAHYCIDRAARIMGLGSKGIIKIATDENYCMKIEDLESKLQDANQQGVKVFSIVGSACSTSTGSFDNLEAIASFAKKHHLWFHVDGAHGGAAVFSKKYKPLLKGIQNADSIIIDCHKMMMTPTIATAVLYKNELNSASTFKQKAEYLYDSSEDFDWSNTGKRTFECTKLMMSVKFMSIIQFGGIGAIEAYVQSLFDNARIFAKIIQSIPGLQLAMQPQANIICFRCNDEHSSVQELNKLNASIRQRILEKGDFYIVQTMLNGNLYLRTTIMNPMTDVVQFKSLLESINRLRIEFAN